MQIPWTGLLAAVLFLASGLPPQNAGEENARASASLTLRSGRTSPLDLEVGGELAGIPAGATRYLTRDDLLRFVTIGIAPIIRTPTSPSIVRCWC
jgi:hypothetical protein